MSSFVQLKKTSKPKLKLDPHRIKTLHDLMAATECKQSVVCPGSNCLRGPIPAAFVVNLPGKVLHKLMLDGMWVYSSK